MSLLRYERDQSAPPARIWRRIESLTSEGIALAYFAKRVKSRSEADDLTQEVFVRLLNHPDRNHGEHLAGYVFTIAANLLRDRAKSVAAAHQKTSQSLDLLAAADVFAPTLVEHVPHPIEIDPVLNSRRISGVFGICRRS